MFKAQFKGLTSEYIDSTISFTSISFGFMFKKYGPNFISMGIAASGSDSMLYFQSNKKQNDIVFYFDVNEDGNGYVHAFLNGVESPEGVKRFNTSLIYYMVSPMAYINMSQHVTFDSMVVSEVSKVGD